DRWRRSTRARCPTSSRATGSAGREARLRLRRLQRRRPAGIRGRRARAGRGVRDARARHRLRRRRHRAHGRARRRGAGGGRRGRRRDPAAARHERDGFIALPGGLGTFEEALEVLTWSQLGIHAKPVGVLNVEGYYDGLLRWLSHAVGEGFVRREHLGLLLFADAPGELLDRFVAWTPPPGPRPWMNESQT